MACRHCHNALRPIPAVYPTWWCPLCGTLLEGLDDGPRWSVPAIQAALGDADGNCLRDDRSRCCVYAAAREAAGRANPLERKDQQDHERDAH